MCVEKERKTASLILTPFLNFFFIPYFSFSYGLAAAYESVAAACDTAPCARDCSGSEMLALLGMAELLPPRPSAADVGSQRPAQPHATPQRSAVASVPSALGSWPGQSV